MNKKQLENESIAKMRKKIDELTAAGDTEAAAAIKTEIHSIYSARRNKKLAIRIGALCAVAIVIIAGLIGFDMYRDKLNARGERIHQSFAGLVFSGEKTTDDGYAEAAKNGTLDSTKTYWQVYEHTTLTFTERGNIDQHSIHDKKLLAYPEGKKKPKDFYNESDSTYYTFEVFVNLKGGVFLHLKDNLYKLELDENDIPQRIIDFNGKDLTLEER